jgi:hypothetical protein
VILLSLIRIGIFTLMLIGFGPRMATGQTFDLTGTWMGSLTCKVANGGVKERTTTAPLLAVTQSGGAVGMRMDFGAGVVDLYTGLANPDGKKPLTKGEVAVIHCGSDDVLGNAPLDELGRFAVATKAAPNPKATLKGTSVFAGSERLGTCTWKWTRTALDDPGVPTSCPAS